MKTKANPKSQAKNAGATRSPLGPAADKIPICSRIISIVIAVVIFGLLPVPGRSQPAPWLSVEAENFARSGNESSSETTNTGNLTSPNPLLVTLNNESADSASASSISVSASYGLLTESASCYANGYTGAGNGNVLSFFNDSTSETSYEDAFYDSLKITSPQPGTTVSFMVTVVDTFQAAESDNDNVVGSPGVEAYFSDGNSFTFTANHEIQCPNNASTNVTWIRQIVNNTTAGSTIDLPDFIELSGIEYGGDYGGLYSGSCSGFASSRVYVNILTPQAGYTSASGTVYPFYLPTIDVTFVPHPNGLIYPTVLLSWPVWATNFVMEQCPDILQKHWITNTSPIVLINGTNEVSVPVTNSMMFFRLISQ